MKLAQGNSVKDDDSVWSEEATFIMNNISLDCKEDM